MRGALALVIASALLAGIAGAVACGDDEENGVTADEYPPEVQLTETDDGTTVKVAENGQLIIALASNASTGFSWSVAEPGPERLELVGEPQYVPPGSTSPVVGAAGTQVFTFDAGSEGTDELTLEYKRGFEPGVEPEQTFTIEVDIKAVE